ncbi:MAG: hypothetical protein M1837_000190 [Sclerophora amabilis]|nr:MAG: hypothetical protein M1837_000190 [Sclerophora amabilis]
MAYSPSPQPSLVMPSNTVHKQQHDAHLTPTPPTQPLSKRDKRRSLLSDKLNEITAAFSQNRDSHYRQQLQALQVDMNLIMQANPYADHPLDDTGDDITALIAGALGGNYAALNGPGANPLGRKAELDMAGLAGRWYSRFVEEVNNNMEERDAALTVLESTHTRTLQELHWNNDFKVRLAKEEHRQLAKTVRERLIQSITHKKSRLMREKEHLDLAESNALLLHPSQFSIANPASPGGAQSNRKTRHTRYRPSDNDDAGAGHGSGEGGHKRKRKAANEDNDIGSPAPVGRVADPGTASPFRDARARLTATQVEAPVYSIDRLFTEKELTMHFNVAQVATAQYFATRKAQENGTGPNNETTGRNSENSGDDGAGSVAAENIQEGNAEEEAAAPDMDRGANQSHHATRSTRNGGPALSSSVTELLAGQNAIPPTSLPGVTLPAAWLPFPPNPNTKKAEPNTPCAIAREDAEDDLARMERLKTEPANFTERRLLDEMCAPIGTQSSHGNILPTFGSSFTSAAAAAMAANHGPAAMGGVPMSAQSSMAGFSDTGGGVAMNRYGEGSSMGPMKRSASGAGFGGMDSVGKRARNR